MPRLIILRGNSGSGKTSLAKLLQRRLGRGVMRISHDMVRMEILNIKAPGDLPLLMEMLRYGHAHAGTTVLEGILGSDAYAPLFQLAKALYGEEIFAYYYDLPFEETLRRHASKPNRDDFGEEDMRRWWRERDLLADIKEKVFGPEISLTAAEEQVLSDLEGRKLP